MSHGISAVTYVDHQQVIGYPVGFSTRSLDICERIYWLCGDDVSARLLMAHRDAHPLAERIEIDVLGLRVATPGDIAAAQNAAVDEVRRRSDPDFVLLVHADTWVPHGAALAICARASASATDTCVSFPARRITMFHAAAWSPWGVTLIGLDSRARFIEDGSYTDQQLAQTTYPQCPPPRGEHVVEVGYWSLEQYGRHKQQHEVTWPEPANVELARLFREDRDLFVERALVRLRDYEFRGPLQILPEDDEDIAALLREFPSAAADYRRVSEISAAMSRGPGKRRRKYRR
jgi:hypothetical protein